MNKTLFTLSAVLVLQFPAVKAEEKYSHFPSLKSTDIQTALCNIQSYNEKLAAITTQAELSTQDMVKIHELSYTLENAVHFLKKTLDTVAVDLEDVHKASERLEQTSIKTSAGKYLTATSDLLAKTSC